MSSGDFAPALTEFFGSAAGLSPSVITRLTRQWQDEQRAFMGRELSDRDFVYVWVDGVRFNVRLQQDRLVAWWLSVSASMAARRCWRSPTASGSPPTPGLVCCAT